MMNRESRFERTANKVKRRLRQWHQVMKCSIPKNRAGRAKDRSLFDCGRSGCEVCNQHTRPEESDRARRAALKGD